MVATAATIVARLEAERARAASPVLLAFDADGTLWTGDVGMDLFDALLESGGVREAAREGLAAEAHAIGLRAEGDALSIARSLRSAYDADAWPLDRAFAAMAWSFAGWPLDDLDAFAENVVLAQVLKSRLRASLSPVIAWAREHAIDVLVVSASPIAIVALGAALVGVPADHVIAMTPAVDAAGIVEPRLAGPVVYGDGKYQAIAAARPGATILGAFGDSAYDAAMLRAARAPFAVAPSAGLVELLPTIPGVTVLPE